MKPLDFIADLFANIEGSFKQICKYYQENQILHFDL